jgi:phage-related protein
MGKMKSYMMDLEEQFIDEVSVHIKGCESVEELMLALVNNDSLKLISHMSTREKVDYINELWNSYWSQYAYG